MNKNFDYCIEMVDGHYYNIYPIGVSIVVLPFVYIIDWASMKILKFSDYSSLCNEFSCYNLDSSIQYSFPRGIELFIASFITALTVVFMYRILLVEETKYPLVIIFIFAFCTSTWSTASRALWQHGPSMLMLTITLFIIVSSKKKPWLIQFAAIPIGFSFVIRPTNIITVFVFTIFVLLHFKRYLINYLLWGTCVAVPFFLYNIHIYNAVTSKYYISRLQYNPHSWVAYIGNLISPGRGLFFFIPVIILSILGAVIKIKTKKFKFIDPYITIIIFFHWIAVSSYPHWWGCHSFGPRFFADMIPFFIYLMSPLPEYILKLYGKKRLIITFFALCLIGFSFFVHYQGATNPHTWIWNSHPNNIDQNPERLWNWKDPQFLRGVYP